MSKTMDRLIREHIAELDKQSADRQRLIAAAPDLLAALNAIAGPCLTYFNGEAQGITHEQIENARAAIAKATGK